MKIKSQLLAIGLVLVVGSRALAADSSAPDAVTPEKLVEQALQGELNGADRAKLLEGAVELNPDFAPARWQLGQVKVAGAWLTADEVPAHAASDANYAAYLKKRDALVDTAEQHRELARWCSGRRLSAEEKLHWGKVLGYEREDREALAALGVRWHEGQLLTREQTEVSKRESAKRQQSLRTWRPQMLKWRQAIEGKDDAKRALAQGELSRLSDPDSLPALESVFATDQTGARADRANLALIGVAERIPQPEATAMLLRQALTSDSPAVLSAACAALKKRPMSAYVPQLIAAMPGSVKSQFRVYTMPNGTVTHEHAVEVANGAGGKQLFTYESVVHPTDLTIAQRITPRAVTNELDKAARIEATAAAVDAPNRQLRERIQSILKQTTGFEDVTDPELLAQQFAEHYGWSKPEKSTAVIHQHANEFATFFPIPPASSTNRTSENAVSLGAPGGQATVNQGRTEPFRSAGAFGNNLGMLGECFAAGTPVMTIAGPRPIETLKAGDRVLAQDPQSGELGYKTVQERTLRLGAKVVTLKIGSESITATYGHPFWVVGTGWQVAGHLQVGARLRGLEQDFVVDAIEEARSTEVYNLLVTDHATYFVGAQRLLVHDDSQVLETGRAVPGLIAKAK